MYQLLGLMSLPLREYALHASAADSQTVLLFGEQQIYPDMKFLAALKCSPATGLQPCRSHTATSSKRREMSRSHENTDLYILKAVWQKIILSKILLLNKILLLIYLKYVQTDIFTSDLCLLSKIILYLANLCAYQLYEICPFTSADQQFG